MVQKLNFDKKKLRALYASYGEVDLFNSGKFKALTRNLTTGALLSQSHHCERCEAKMKIACYENLHYGFCSEWVSRSDKRERCGERFAFRSAGCGKHPSSKGFNAAFYRAAEGEDVDLCDFDDTNDLNVDDEAECKVDMKAEMELADALLEEHIKEHGYASASFHAKHFAGMLKTFKLKKNQKLEVAFAESVDQKSRNKHECVAPDTNSTCNVRTFQSKRATKKSFAPKGKGAKPEQ